MEKLLVTKNDVCKMLSMGRDALDKIIKTDSNFPRPIKKGDSRQASVYFKVKEIHRWVDSLSYFDLNDASFNCK